MWCANCRADVAAEVAVDNRRIHCATCGAEIAAEHSLTASVKTREARELLQRWSSEQLNEPLGHEPSSPEKSPESVPDDSSNPGTSDPGQPEKERTAPFYRWDRPHAPADGQQPSSTSAIGSQPGDGEAAGAHNRGRRLKSESDDRVDAAHPAAQFSPHFDVRAARPVANDRAANWATMLGPVLAYLGVALLTIGTCLVLFGYFGGPENQRFTPTGWLIATAGQMLLFLGVVTLVSGGMEQTTEEVKRRIETLGEKILRIEQVSREHALKGPNFDAEQIAHPAGQTQPGGGVDAVPAGRQSVLEPAETGEAQATNAK